MDLANVLDSYRIGDWPPGPPKSARQMWIEDLKKVEWVPGASLARTIPHLVHYTTDANLNAIQLTGRIGFGAEPNVFLTPTAYNGWTAPTDLGLSRPCQVALLIDVGAIPKLWGPGRAKESRDFPEIWRGGGVEFYVPEAIPYEAVVQVVWCEEGYFHRIEGLP